MEMPLLMDMTQHPEDPGGGLVPRVFPEAEVVSSLQSGK